MATDYSGRSTDIHVRAREDREARWAFAQAERAAAHITWFNGETSLRMDQKPGPGFFPTHWDGERLYTLRQAERITGIALGLLRQWAERGDIGHVLDAGTTAERRYFTQEQLDSLSPQ